MENRVNYTVVGLLVLLLGAAGIIIPLWLSSGLNKQEYTTYSVTMNESIDGLSEDAQVNYNGVNVGRVKRIKLNPKNTQQVELLLDIKLGTPITTHTTATLQSQGVTGVAYIGLNGGEIKGAVLLKLLKGEQYPRIKALPSIRVRLDTALTTLMDNLTVLNKRLQTLINPENAKAVSEILHNIDKITIDLSSHGKDIDKNLAVLNKGLNNFSQASQSFPAAALRMQEIMLDMGSITQEIKQNPSVIFRGKTNLALGPGETGEK